MLALRRKQLSLLLAENETRRNHGIESFIHVIKVDKLLVFYRNRIILKEKICNKKKKYFTKTYIHHKTAI
jgi:hypothetical protein